MKRVDIIARRRRFVMAGYETLADVGFDGDWVTPLQMESNSETGPVLIALHWLDAASARKLENQAVLRERGYLPHIPFNLALSRALEQAGLTRRDVHLTQAFHLLPRNERSKYIPPQDIDDSFEEITRYEVEDRSVIALGGAAQGACRRARVPHIKCVHPSARGRNRQDKANELAAALVDALAQTGARSGTRKGRPTTKRRQSTDASMCPGNDCAPLPRSAIRGVEHQLDRPARRHRAAVDLRQHAVDRLEGAGHLQAGQLGHLRPRGPTPGQEYPGNRDPDLGPPNPREPRDTSPVPTDTYRDARKPSGPAPRLSE